MSKADFLRNNRGINDGGDLPQVRGVGQYGAWVGQRVRAESWAGLCAGPPSPLPFPALSLLQPAICLPHACPTAPPSPPGCPTEQAFMEALYDRIISNEIKMKDEGLLGPGAQQQAGAGAASAGWLDTIMNLLPGRAKAASAEPNDEAIRRTHEHLRCVPAGWLGYRRGRGMGWLEVVVCRSGSALCCPHLAAALPGVQPAAQLSQPAPSPLTDSAAPPPSHPPFAPRPAVRRPRV